MRITACLCLSLLLSTPSPGASAESTDANADLGAAWRAYKEAVTAGDIERTVAAAQNAVTAGRAVLAKDDARLPVLLVNLGKAHIAVNAGEEARNAFREALKLSEKIHGKTAPELLDPLEGLARAEGRLRDESRQWKYYRRALDIAAAYFGEDSPEYADLAVTAAVEAQAATFSTHGRQYLLRARDIYIERFGATSEHTGLVHYHLGRFAYAEADYDKALEHLETALPIIDGAGEELATYRRGVHVFLVGAYEELDRGDMATEHLLAIAELSPPAPDVDPAPVYRVMPIYPVRMLETRSHGQVDLRFSIDPTGRVRDIEVTDVTVDRNAGRSELEDAAVTAFEQFRYAPGIVDGEAVAIEDLTARMTFSISGSNEGTIQIP